MEESPASKQGNEEQSGTDEGQFQRALNACSFGTTGSWDALASWYWVYFDEIEVNLCRKISEERIPSKPLRDKLVGLYFRHVHPLCPIFDEVDFHASYFVDDEEFSFLKCISLLEFQCMMFTASLHLNTGQLQNTSFQTTLDCHNTLFNTAKKTYHACPDASPLVLARAALLLSYWSPYSSETQSNNYWVNEAFKHAINARLYESDGCCNIVDEGRRRIIWWCCLIRDRLLALALHKSHCLHKDTPLCQRPSETDFGLESVHPKFMDEMSKSKTISNFIHQCELVGLIGKVLLFQLTWGDVKSRIITLEEVTEVGILHDELEEWQARSTGLVGVAKNPSIECCNMPCQLTQIFYHSAIGALYLPYTPVDPYANNPLALQFSTTAFQEITGAASQIAKITEQLAYNVDSNDIPLSIGAWLSFPIAVKLALLGNVSTLADPAAELQEMRSLMSVLYILKERFSGGRFLCEVVDKVISCSFMAGAGEERGHVVKVLAHAMGIIKMGLKEGIVAASKL